MSFIANKKEPRKDYIYNLISNSMRILDFSLVIDFIFNRAWSYLSHGLGGRSERRLTVVLFGRLGCPY